MDLSLADAWLMVRTMANVATIKAEDADAVSAAFARVEAAIALQLRADPASNGQAVPADN